MAEHTLLLSGYGAPGCDDLAVCRLESDGTLRTLFTARHGHAPSFCCQGENGWIYVASERQDGADITAYALEDGGFREIASLEIPGGQALCHLYPLGNVIYGSCFGNGLFFAVSGDLSRILWKFQPGAQMHTGRRRWDGRSFWRIWGITACIGSSCKIICRWGML